MIYDRDSEAEVLGTVLSEPALFRRLDLDASDFFVPEHRAIWSRIATIIDEGHPISANLIAHHEPGHKVLIAGLLNDATTRSQATAAARIIRRHRLHRDLKEISDVPLEDQAIADAASNALTILQDIGSARGWKPKRMGETIADDLASLERGRTIQTGLANLDEKIGGFGPGQLVVVAGRPGHGKSSMLAGFALAAARQDERVYFVTLEMPRPELVARIASWETHLSVHSFTAGMDEGDWAKVHEASADLLHLPLYIDERGDTTVAQIGTEARRLAASGGLDMVVIDYMQLLRAEGRSLYERITNVTRQLKLLAKELGVPVIVGAQLNREVERRDDHRPRLADLRDSGSVEQDSDIVLLLHRPFLTGDSPDFTKASLVVAKQRQGPTGNISLHFDPPTTKFSVDYGRL